MDEGRSGDEEACCCPCVITVPLTMVHFSERGGLEEEVETADTTHPRTDDVTSWQQFQGKVHLMKIKQEVDWGGVGSGRSGGL